MQSRMRSLTGTSLSLNLFTRNKSFSSAPVAAESVLPQQSGDPWNQFFSDVSTQPPSDDFPQWPGAALSSADFSSPELPSNAWAQSPSDAQSAAEFFSPKLFSDASPAAGISSPKLSSDASLAAGISLPNSLASNPRQPPKLRKRRGKGSLDVLLRGLSILKTPRNEPPKKDYAECPCFQCKLRLGGPLATDDGWAEWGGGGSQTEEPKGTATNDWNWGKWDEWKSWTEDPKGTETTQSPEVFEEVLIKANDMPIPRLDGQQPGIHAPLRAHASLPSLGASSSASSTSRDDTTTPSTPIGYYDDDWNTQLPPKPVWPGKTGTNNIWLTPIDGEGSDKTDIGLPQIERHIGGAPIKAHVGFPPFKKHFGLAPIEEVNDFPSTEETISFSTNKGNVGLPRMDEEGEHKKRRHLPKIDDTIMNRKSLMGWDGRLNFQAQPCSGQYSIPAQRLFREVVHGLGFKPEDGHELGLDLSDLLFEGNVEVECHRDERSKQLAKEGRTPSMGGFNNGAGENKYASSEFVDEDGVERTDPFKWCQEGPSNVDEEETQWDMDPNGQEASSRPITAGELVNVLRQSKRFSLLRTGDDEALLRFDQYETDEELEDSTDNLIDGYESMTDDGNVPTQNDCDSEFEKWKADYQRWQAENACVAEESVALPVEKDPTRWSQEKNEGFNRGWTFGNAVSVAEP